MDLLLQAARVIELANSGDGAADRISSKSARGRYFGQHAKSKTENSEDADDSQTYSENGVSAGDEEIPLIERTSRRVGGIGTREVHNQLEKNRRKQLREFFTHLQQCVPSLENKRVATQSILQGAIKHIKNLKKKDVEQEREIQMLAKRKSELKKKYDLEFNKCTEDQQRVAETLLKVIRAKVDVVYAEQSGHTSDSTSTASEGPGSEDFSDEEKVVVQQSLKINTSAGNSEGRKRKLTPRTSQGHGVKVSEAPSGSSKSAVSSRSVISSSVSSSSVALKHMLEQRKRNQTAASQVSTPSSVTREVPISPQTSRGPGSLTYSYPMITTHLASAVKSVPSTSRHGITHTNHLMTQSSMVAVGSTTASNAAFSLSQSLMSTIINPDIGVQRKGKKSTHIRNKRDNTSSHSTVTMHNPSLLSQKINTAPVLLPPESPLKVVHSTTLFPTNITLVQPPAITVKTSEVRKVDSSFTTSQEVVASVPGIDVQSFSYLGKAVIGNHTGALSIESPASVSQPLDMNSSPTKMLPTVIPFSLASIIRSLPVNAGLSHIVTLASSPLVISSSTGSPITTSMAEVAASLNSKLHFSQNANFLLSASPVTSQQNSLSLSTNNARIATLLAAPSTHITSSSSNNVIKQTSPINSRTSTISPSAIPVTLAPTLVPLSLTSGPLATSVSTSISPGTPLRIFTPASQNPVMAASLTNGQSPLMSTVVQLEAGQVALLQNLIPGQHVQVQNPLQILTQPIVLMATSGPNFCASSSTVTTSS